MDEIQEILIAEGDKRNELSIKYNRGVNIIGVIDNCLGVTTIGLGITGVSLLKENNIIVGNKEYASTPGLWELIAARSPEDKIFTNGNYDNYAEIMMMMMMMMMMMKNHIQNCVQNHVQKPCSKTMFKTVL